MMTTQALERAEKALRDEVERQVQAQGSYSGPENGSPDYVDANLDYPALCRAVLMAVREPDEAMSIAGYAEISNEPTHADFDCAWRASVDAILGENDDAS